MTALNKPWLIGAYMNNPLIELHYPDGTIKIQQLHNLKKPVDEMYLLLFDRDKLEVRRIKYENTHKNNAD